MPAPSFIQQFNAMMLKNLRLRRRNILGIVLEFLFPLLVVATTCLYVIGTRKIGLSQQAVLEFPEQRVSELTMAATALEGCTVSGSCTVVFSPELAASREMSEILLDVLFENGAVARLPPFFARNASELRSEFSRQHGHVFAGVDWGMTPVGRIGHVFNYTIFLNSTFMPMLFIDPRPVSRAFSHMANASLYVLSGFATVQNAADTAILLRAAFGNNSPTSRLRILVNASLLPTPERGSAFGSLVSMLVGIIFILAFVPYVVIGMMLIGGERRSNMREYLFINGLSRWAYWASWAATLLIPALFTAGATLVGGFASGIFKGTNPVLTVSIVLAFSASCIVFSILATTAVSSTPTALVVGFCWLYVPAQVVPFLPAHPVVYHILYFIAPVDMYLAVVEAITASVRSATIATPLSVVSMQKLIAFLIGDTILYSALAWYFHQVRPGKFGVPQPYLFPFQRRYWRPAKSSPDIQEKNIQSISSLSLRAIRGHGVSCVNVVAERKLGGVKVCSLNDFSANFERGRSSAILGHVGSGKSSLLSVLSGLLKPTSGSAAVHGMSIRTSMDGIRQILGICPQHDILYDNLTAFEHLQLIGMIRGIDQVKTKSREMLAHVGLTHQVTGGQVVSKFTNGMQRRLSIAAALFGDPDVVFLDEPTSSLDSQSRKHIWSIIEAHKADRTILISTSSMKEAETLCESIYIVSGGHLCCSGTPQFLKERFGVGYFLTFEQKQEAATSGQAPPLETVAKIVQQHVPEAVPASKCRIQLPYGCESTLPPALTELEEGADKLGIQNIGISLTTLEDVFARLGSQDAPEELEHVQTGTLPPPPSSSSRREEFPLPSVSATYGDAFPDLEKSPLILPEVTPRNQIKAGRRAWATIRALVWLKLLFFARHRVQVAAIFLLPALLLFIFVATTKWTITEHDPMLDVLSIYRFAPVEVPFSVTPGVSEADLGRLLSVVAVPGNLTFKRFESPAAIRNHTRAIGGYFSSILFRRLSLSDGLLEATYLYNDSRPYSFICTQHIVDLALLRVLTNTSDAELHLHSFAVHEGGGGPPPLVDATIIYACMALAGGFLVVEGIFLSSVIPKVAGGLKAQLILAGANPLLIAAVNIVSGAAMFLPSILLSTFIMWELQVAATAAVVIPFLLVCLLFSFVMSALNYCLSFFIHTNSAVAWVTLCEFFISIVPWAVKTLLSVMDPKAFMTVNLVISVVTDVIPMCAFISAIIDASHSSKYRHLSQLFRWGYGNEFVPDTISLSLNLVLFTCLSLYIERRFDRVHAASLAVRPQLEEPDADVQLETKLVLSGESEKDASVVMKRIRKVYPQEQAAAIHDLSLSIPKGQFFVLLGPSGAGKTTTLRMLAGDLSATSGTVSVNGNLLGNRKSTFQQEAKIGFCPQVDPLVDCLTVRDHLELVYTVQTCLPPKGVRALVNATLDRFKLTPFASRRAVSCSGAVRRRLSVAMAFLPGKDVVLLDEPTSWMEPRSKTVLWKLMQKENEAGKTIVLTTHTIEEAETVGSRIAILANGFVQCLGSADHLRAKFNNGYHLAVELEDEDDTAACDELVSRVTESGNVLVTEVSGNWRTYRLGRVRSIAAIFSLLERVKSQYGINDYEISSTSLDDIYSKLSSGASVASVDKEKKK